MTTRISKSSVTRAALAALLLAFGGAAVVLAPAPAYAAAEKKEDAKAAAKDKKAAKEEKAAEAKPAEAADQGSIKLGNPTVAIVDGEEVKRSDVFTFISQLPPQLQQMPIEQLFPMALEELA